jgi:hypothetical protein
VLSRAASKQPDDVFYMGSFRGCCEIPLEKFEQS